MNLWIHNMMCAIDPLSFVMATSNDGNTVGATDTSIGDSSFTHMTHVRLTHLGARSSPWCPSCERPSKTNLSRSGACILNIAASV